MKVYIYNADIYCEDCGKAIRKQLKAEGFAPEDPSDETTYDSDEYPKGPYDDGGGTADCPQHCGSGSECLNAHKLNDGTKVGAFLENPLTSYGLEYIRAELENDPDNEVVLMWYQFYQEDLEWT